MVLVVLAKWLLVSHNEIVSEPYDAAEYIGAANKLTQGLGNTSLGYPIWLWLGLQTGLPQRFLIEGLWLCASVAFALTVAHATGRRWLAVPATAILAFAPATLFLFDRALTEGLFLCLSLVLATVSLALLDSTTLRSRLVLGVTIGLLAGFMSIVRNEMTLLVPALLAVGVAWIACERWHRAHTWSLVMRSAVPLGLVIAVTTALPTVSVSTINLIRQRVYTANLAEMPSHMGLLARLAAIDSGQPNRRYIPISHQARELAYAVSPTLSRFRLQVEDPANLYQQVTASAYGTSGEIGAGWIWHVFNQAAPTLGATTIREVDALYRQASVELDAAFVDGRLTHRFAPHPFLGSDSQAWRPYVVEGLRHVLSCLATPSPPVYDQDFRSDDFDRICHRRNALIPRQATTVTGWAFARDPALTIDRITLASMAGPSPTRAFERFPRPDVERGFAAQGIVTPAQTGFRLVVAGSVQPTDMHFTSGSSPLGTWSNFTVGKAVSLPGPDGLTLIDAGIDRIESQGPAWQHGLHATLLAFLIRLGSSPWAWAVGCGAVMISLTWACYRNTRCILTPVGLCSIVLITWAALRLCFYALITAGAWVAEPRYLQAATTTLMAAVILVMALPWCGLPQRHQQ